MKIITSVREMAEWGQTWGKDCGLVPTLGALHEGHASLIKRARSENRKVAVSVFVNPLQFRRKQYLIYRRDLKGDTELAKKAGADVLFAPSDDAMYPAGFEGRIILPKMFKAVSAQKLEWHYKGVLAVVMKLFQIIRPNRAYFGLKDPHQLALIERMTADFNIPVQIRKCPTIREKDGLARSSRNALLSPAERKAAGVIYKALSKGKKSFLAREGLKNSMDAMKKTIAEEKLARLLYIEIVDPSTFAKLGAGSKEALIFAAVSIGGKRLTDNIRFILGRKLYRRGPG